MDELNRLRREIDELDDTLMELLEKRFNISKQIGYIKKKNTLDVTHPGREQAILNKASSFNNKDSIEAVYATIFKTSKLIQK